MGDRARELFIARETFLARRSVILGIVGHKPYGRVDNVVTPEGVTTHDLRHLRGVSKYCGERILQQFVWGLLDGRLAFGTGVSRVVLLRFDIFFIHSVLLDFF